MRAESSDLRNQISAPFILLPSSLSLSSEIPCKLGNRDGVFRRTMSFLASFMNLGGPDLLVILVIILVLFGAKKLPELARGLGQAIKEFQKAKDEFTDELHKAGNTDTTAKTNPPQSTVPQNPPAGGQTNPNPSDKA